MNLMLFAPELVLLLGSLLLFVVTLGEGRGGLARNLSVLVGLVLLAVTLATLGREGELFFAAYRVDLFSQLFKALIAFGFLLVLLFNRSLKDVAEDVRPEYYLFMTLSTTGLVMLVSSVELLTLFIALELSSYSLYLMVPMRDDRHGMRAQMEAAIKYLMFGVVATGIMLFGMSYLFGLTGTTYLHKLLPALHSLGATPAVVCGLAMVLGGFFFKLAVFPFHFWVPDVYQGANNATTAFIASVPKLGAVALLIRITMLISPEGQMVVNLMMVAAVCSMFYGNLSALVQKDIKRMLGFSGIAHAGYVLLGLITLKDSGYAASMYYIVGYLLMNLACFLVICTVSREGENVLIEDLSGLHKRSPLLALTLLVGMFALAGIPPFVGFMGKFFLLAGALQQGYLALVILAALNTAISIYYYLSVVRVAFCTDPEERPAVAVDGLTGLVSVFLMVIILAMGCMPTQVMEVATQAVGAIL
ncbi:MAG: NADH-quinone oxidoreductase subunit N [Thermodesulfobacteriota bacterium]